MTTSIVALSQDYWNVLGKNAGAIVLYAVVGLIMMVIGFYAIDLTTPGQLRRMVNACKPNAIIVTAAGMVSMAFIVVIAIYASSGKLAEGLIASAVYGLVGIAAQVVSMRVATVVLGIRMDRLFQADEYRCDVLMVAAAQLALGMVVAVAIL